MLGQQIGELKGKVTGKRVLDADGPTTETSLSFSGSFLATPVKANLTIVDRPAAAGVFHAKGQAVIMAGESELATWRVEAIGRISSSGGRKVSRIAFLQAHLQPANWQPLTTWLECLRPRLMRKELHF